MSATATNGTVENLTQAEAAARVGVSERTVSRWIAAGKLAARRDPRTRRIFIRAADVDALVGADLVAVEPAGG